MHKWVLTVLQQLAVYGLGVAFLTGCVIAQPPAPDDPAYAPVMAPTPSAPVTTNGSLFSGEAKMNLFSDKKARNIGDILTVTLAETTVSQKTSNVSVSKDSETTIPEAAGAAGTLLGQGVSLGSYGLGTNLSAERDFEGAADADQSNNLRGTIAVTVVDVWPNGALVVRGEKWLTLNRGEEFIRLSGVVRPEDVSADNTIASSRIANARISYAGKGALADSQQMGWLSRFFNSAYWPF